MKISEIFKVIAKLEPDPFTIYDTIEEAYHKNFLEGVIMIKYSHLYDENTEEKFMAQIKRFRNEVVEQIASIKVGTANEIEMQK